jgi:DMSO/TMAO reductase YedYZ molybdopterin-dependent catalytic subunit
MRRRDFLASLGLGSLMPFQALDADHHVVSADPYEVEVDLCSAYGRYTPVEDFYIRNHHPAPQSGAPALEISGEVERLQTLTPNALAQLPRVELGAVLECAGNPVSTKSLAGNGLWSGWRLADVLALAHPSPAGAFLHLTGRDGYTRGVALQRASSDALLATHLNGKAIERNHGFPWRILFPGWYGMDSVKWVERIVVSRTALPATGQSYLQVIREPTGFRSESLPQIQVKSVIASPCSGSVVKPGRLEVRGMAWSGQGKITQVEVSSDGGSQWEKAAFQASPQYEWVLWESPLELSRRGAVELVARASDEHSHQQPEVRDAHRVDRYAQNWLHRVRLLVV